MAPKTPKLPNKDCAHYFTPWADHNENLYKFRFCTRVDCKYHQLVIRPGVYRIWRSRFLIKKSRKSATFLIPVGTKSIYLGGPRAGIYSAIGSDKLYRAEFGRAQLVKIIKQLSKIIRCVCFGHDGDPRFVRMQPDVKYMLEPMGDDYD